MNWPDDDALKTLLPLPEGVTLRAWKSEELDALPELLREWYPAITVGSESIWLDRDFLRTATDSFALAICSADQPVGFQGFTRDVRSRTLHGRLGVLSPSARTGFLGALGFPMFEALGRFMNADLLSVWVTLESKGQQLAAERAHFQLVSVVNGFDLDMQPDGCALRVPEALYVKLLADPSTLKPLDEKNLTAKTRAFLKLSR